jgi:hypothetical protein
LTLPMAHTSAGPDIVADNFKSEDGH